MICHHPIISNSLLMLSYRAGEIHINTEFANVLAYCGCNSFSVKFNISRLFINKLFNNLIKYLHGGIKKNYLKNYLRKYAKNILILYKLWKQKYKAQRSMATSFSDLF